MFASSIEDEPLSVLCVTLLGVPLACFLGRGQAYAASCDLSRSRMLASSVENKPVASHDLLGSRLLASSIKDKPLPLRHSP